MLGKTAAVMLAPAYDLLSTAVYDGEFGAELSRGMGMRVGEHLNIDRVTERDFALLAKNLGMTAAALSGIARDLAETLPSAMGKAAATLAERTSEDIGELVERVTEGIEKRSRTCMGM